VIKSIRGKNNVCATMIFCTDNVCASPGDNITSISTGYYSCQSAKYTRKRKMFTKSSRSWRSSASTTPPGRSTPPLPSTRRTARGVRRVEKNMNMNKQTDRIVLTATATVTQGYGVHEQRDEGGHEHAQAAQDKGPACKKPAPWRLVKKRGIIPDGLVQARLDMFVKSFPNLRGGGGSSNNNKSAGLFSTNDNEGLVAPARKRKLEESFVQTGGRKSFKTN
jgi:hypothetical protein